MMCKASVQSSRASRGHGYRIARRHRSIDVDTDKGADVRRDIAAAVVRGVGASSSCGDALDSKTSSSA